MTSKQSPHRISFNVPDFFIAYFSLTKHTRVFSGVQNECAFCILPVFHSQQPSVVLIVFLTKLPPAVIEQLAIFQIPETFFMRSDVPHLSISLYDMSGQHFCLFEAHAAEQLGDSDLDVPSRRL